MSSNSSVVILGDVFADLFCFLEGGLPTKVGGDSRLAKPITTVAGGSGLNTATHLMGIMSTSEKTYCNVRVYSAFNPNDEYGKLVCQHATEHNFSLINTCDDNDASTGHCAVIVASDERTFMTHLGAMEKFKATDIDIDSVLQVQPTHSGCLHIHVAGYFNIPGFWKGQIKHLLSTFAERQYQQNPQSPLIVSLVTQYDATEEWDGQLLDLLPSIDYLILNEIEAKNIIQAAHRRMDRREDIETLDNEEDVLLAIAAFFASQSSQTCIVLTLGPKGACVLYGGKIIVRQSPPLFVEHPLDPTGAGDSFIAGFLHGLYSNSSSTPISKSNTSDPTILKRGLQYGCILGTSCVMRSGASVPACQEEIDDLLQRISK